MGSSNNSPSTIPMKSNKYLNNHQNSHKKHRNHRISIDSIDYPYNIHKISTESPILCPSFHPKSVFMPPQRWASRSVGLPAIQGGDGPLMFHWWWLIFIPKNHAPSTMESRMVYHQKQWQWQRMFRRDIRSIHGGFLKWGHTYIIHFNGIFPYEPSS